MDVGDSGAQPKPVSIMRMARRLTGEWFTASYGAPVWIGLPGVAAVGHLWGDAPFVRALALGALGACGAFVLLALAALWYAPVRLLKQERAALAKAEARLASSASRLATARARLRDWAHYFETLARQNAGDAEPVFTAIDQCASDVAAALGAHAARAIEGYMGQVVVIPVIENLAGGATRSRAIGQFKPLRGLASHLADLAANTAADDLRPEFAEFVGSIPKPR